MLFFSEKILLRAHQEFGVKTWLRLGYGDGVLEKSMEKIQNRFFLSILGSVWRQFAQI